MGKKGKVGPKLKGKRIKWGRRDGEVGKGIKNKREREKKAKKGKNREGREEKGKDDSTEKITKMKKKGEGKVKEDSLDILK